MDTNPTPTISDVAKQAGVSIATVSRVLNNSNRVSPATAQRVNDAISELGFVPRTAARVLASRKTHIIGLILPEIAGAFFSAILRGIEAEVRQAGYGLLIHSTQGGHSTRPLGEHNTDGLLIFTNSLEKDELSHLHRTRFPSVLLYETPPEGVEIPVITIENKSGAEKLMDHLILRHNRRRIVFLQGPPENEDSYWREYGYRERLQAHGLPFDPALIGLGDFSEEQAYKTVQRMLMDGVHMDAIFAGDDESAIGAIRALRQSGVRVPEDVSVVGFDDIPLSAYFSPALTTVKAPIEQVGRQAVRQLLSLISHQPANPLTLLHTELVIRHSCGCPV
jgi:DNA-binding LacI/PurR family transcriptional regulator